MMVVYCNGTIRGMCAHLEVLLCGLEPCLGCVGEPAVQVAANAPPCVDEGDDQDLLKAAEWTAL